MKQLQVFYEGWGERWPLGWLADNGQALLFEYSAEAQARGLELSPLHLPLRAEAYGDFPRHLFRLPGLIADALPDGWGLLLMDRLFRQMGREVAQISPLDRLAFIGSRAIGALTFEPADEAQLHTSDVALLALARDVRAVVSGQDGDLLRELALMGGSPHGARPKVLVNYAPQQGVMSTGALSDGAPWLVKFPAQTEHKEVCAIEALYAELASRCGLAMPQVQYFDLGEELSAFGIARFDRQGETRIPVHSLAGLLHANFRVPSSVDYVTFLRATRMLTRDEREVEKAFARAVFNILFHNRDDHCKNFAYVLQSDGDWKLAPGFDLTFNEGPAGEHQMDVCGYGKEISKSHLQLLAEKSDVSPSVVSDVLARHFAVADEFLAIASGYAIRSETLNRIAQRIRENRARLLN
jgi:serine/threonine-protein kinase HipA